MCDIDMRMREKSKESLFRARGTRERKSLIAWIREGRVARLARKATFARARAFFSLDYSLSEK